jgi:hypothetical protein
MGESGARKSTAIKQWKDLMTEVGYTNFAPAKASKEGLIIELSEISNNGYASADDILEKNLFSSSSDSMEPAEIFIPADEFNNFIGVGNLDFASFLGDLWDYSGVFKYKLKNSKPVYFKDPLISMLAGNTLSNLMQCFPSHVLEQGFFSRLIFAYSEKNPEKIHKPYEPTTQEVSNIQNQLLTIQTNCVGEFKINPGADILLEKIYLTQHDLPDIRFKSYSNRRYTHLLKMCMIHAAAFGSTEITERDVIYANTILTYTETFMPLALGEFGKSKHSSVTHKIIQLIDSSDGVTTFKDVWKYVYQDLDKQSELGELLQNLTVADRIQAIHTKEVSGFLPNKKSIEEKYKGLVDYSYLTPEERKRKI